MSKAEQSGADTAEIKSKSQVKRELQAIQTLGEQLVKLTPAALLKIPMDEELHTAVQLARNINRKRDGYRRQLQFIGKLLRNRELTAIEDAIDKLQQHQQLANTRAHQLEALRETLLTGGDREIQAIVAKHPQLERQKLRQLVRQAHKEQQQQKGPAAARALFKYLRSELDLA